MKSWPGASIAGLLLIFAVNIGFARSEFADDPHLGITEYEIACMPCHGVNGRGDGRLAKSLSKPPADLTQIAKSHGGKFPMKEVEEMIDGRAIVAAHADRDMPVWGDRYRAPVQGQSCAWVEQQVRAQIRALANYLKSLQEK
jgi:hypothetical protein